MQQEQEAGVGVIKQLMDGQQTDSIIKTMTCQRGLVCLSYTERL